MIVAKRAVKRGSARLKSGPNFLSNSNPFSNKP
jgi:hypothetical protein